MHIFSEEGITSTKTRPRLSMNGTFKRILSTTWVIKYYSTGCCSEIEQLFKSLTSNGMEHVYLYYQIAKSVRAISTKSRITLFVEILFKKEDRQFELFSLQPLPYYHSDIHLDTKYILQRVIWWYQSIKCTL